MSCADQATDEWIGLISGLDIGSPSPSDAQIQMLVEYLAGEEGGVQEQVNAAQISRLIIAGNSLATLEPTGRGEGELERRRPVRITIFVIGTLLRKSPVATLWIRCHYILTSSCPQSLSTPARHRGCHANPHSSRRDGPIRHHNASTAVPARDVRSSRKITNFLM
jgi:hypothetical protein